MDMLCPECMGPLATADGQKARCTIHGGEYQIIYSREPLAGEVAAGAVVNHAPAKSLPFDVACPGCGQKFEATPEHVGATAQCTHCLQSFEIQAPPAMCKHHAHVAAQFVCAACGAPLCGTCAFPNPAGGHWCPDCAVTQARRPQFAGLGTPVALPTKAPTTAPAFPPSAAVMCVVHRDVPAVHRCAVCQAPVCATCDFAFPGGVHVCPACASKPQTGVGQRRKKPLIASYVLAVWCSLGLAVLLSGVLAPSLHTPSDVQALGMVLMIFVFIPSIVGTAMAVSSVDRRLGNPPVIWISVVWNSLILAILLLLTIIGNLKK